MFSKQTIVSAVALAGAMCLPLTAHAAQPGFYLGGSFGSADNTYLQQNEAAYKVFGGFNFNHFLGMELSYVNLGTNYNDAGYTDTIDGYSYELVGNIPVSPYMDLFAKAGFYNWNISDSYYGYSITSGSNNDYGFGINAQVARQLWIRGEYQKFMDVGVSGGDINLVSVGLTYHFGYY
jgi:hypothetical protein